MDDGPVDTAALAAKEPSSRGPGGLVEKEKKEDGVEDDERDLSWSTVLKRTMEGFVRGERPNQYGEWISWVRSSLDPLLTLLSRGLCADSWRTFGLIFSLPDRIEHLSH